MTTVYTYYEPILPGQVEEIAIWRQSWERYGWQAVVLGPEALQGYAGLADLERRFSQFPTHNVKRYEMACFLRWLALALVGGGLLTDYDCVNIGFTPEQYDAAIADKRLFSFSGGGPGVFYADADSAMELVEKLASYRPTPQTAETDMMLGSLHISDLTIMASLEFESVNLCRQPEQHKPAAKIVHCSHDSVWHMNPRKARWEVMRDILEATAKGATC